MQGRVQLGCRHVDIEWMTIHDDNPNQGFCGGGGAVSGVQGMEKGGRGIHSNNPHK